MEPLFVSTRLVGDAFEIHVIDCLYFQKLIDKKLNRQFKN